MQLQIMLHRLVEPTGGIFFDTYEWVRVIPKQPLTEHTEQMHRVADSRYVKVGNWIAPLLEDLNT